MKLLRTINRLKDPRDFWLFLKILFSLILLPWKIENSTLPGLLTRLDPEVSPNRQPRRKLEKTVSFVDSLLRYRVFQRYGKCLLRTLILFRFLRQQGWPVDINFGVRKTAEGKPDITGHSWLELDGEPFLETETGEKYVTTYSYSGRRTGIDSQRDTGQVI